MIGCIIGLLFILLIPKGVDSIQNVAVNPENGDIAYVSFNNEYSVIYLVVFDSLGNELFSETLDSGRGGTQAYLVYKGNTLNICSGRKKAMYAFNRDGKQTTENILSKDEIINVYNFQGWNKSHRTKWMSVNNNKYVYREAPFPKYIFNNFCELYIEKSDGTRIVLYQD